MGILSTAAKVAVASSIHGRVQRRQQQRWAAQDAAAAGPVAPHPASAPSPFTPNPLVPAAPPPDVPAPQAEVEDPMVRQLRQLAGLRDAGVLTDEEFAAKKAKVLGI